MYATAILIEPARIIKTVYTKFNVIYCFLCHEIVDSLSCMPRITIQTIFSRFTSVMSCKSTHTKKSD